MDAKIVVASATALIFISGFFLAGGGLGSLLGDALKGFGDIARTSPFEGFFVSSPGGGHTHALMEIRKENISFRPDRPVNITWNGQYVNGFGGVITLDYENGAMKLADRQLETGLELQDYSIHGLSLSSLEFVSAGYEINGQVKAANGSLSIKGFSGSGRVNKNSLVLEGNVSLVKAVENGVVWELK